MRWVSPLQSMLHEVSRSMKIVIITLWLLLLAVWDIKCKKLPLWLLSLGVVTGMFVFFLMVAESGMVSFSVLLGTVGGGVLLLALAFLTGTVGYADGVVVIAMGLLTGYRHTVAMLGMSFLLASFYCGGLLVTGKARRHTQIPFVPFLLLGWMLAIILCGEELW